MCGKANDRAADPAAGPNDSWFICLESSVHVDANGPILGQAGGGNGPGGA
ncbi:hypothetical protein LCGC14_2630240, partial [marine sediment metagenome]